MNNQDLRLELPNLIPPLKHDDRRVALVTALPVGHLAKAP